MPPYRSPTNPGSSEKSRDPLTDSFTEIVCQVATQQTISHKKLRLFSHQDPFIPFKNLEERSCNAGSRQTEDHQSIPNDISSQNEREIVNKYVLLTGLVTLSTQDAKPASLNRSKYRSSKSGTNAKCCILLSPATICNLFYK